jgi:hypothetical protein
METEPVHEGKSILDMDLSGIERHIIVMEQLVRTPQMILTMIEWAREDFTRAGWSKVEVEGMLLLIARSRGQVYYLRRKAGE